MTIIVDYLILFLVAIIAISLPELFAVYSGVHLNQTVPIVVGLAAIYAVIRLQMRRRKRENAADASLKTRTLVICIVTAGVWIAVVYLAAPFVVDAIWPVGRP